MSETASLNEITVHFETQNGGGERSILGALEGPLQDENDSSGDPGAAPVSEKSKSPFINAAATSLNEESDQPAGMNGKLEQSDERIENLVALFRDFLEAAPNPATSKSTHTQRNTTGGKRFFGLTKSSQPETGLNNPYDYEQKYPRDRYGEEAADNARVWLTYIDEAQSFDRERVEGWKDTVDVLLVFAGLFSGVITTFVSQASQSLQQDNTQVSSSLLFEITQLLRAQSNGTPLNNITSSPLTPTSPFTPSTNALLVNGLWFTSLAIALSTALFAVLSKQWLHYYLTSISGTAHEKARARHLRYKGFELWNVGAIVELLPILLYIAVGMFLTGIIILLFPLDVRVAWTLVVITGITYILYFISVLLPIQYPECPYTTSLTIYIGILVFALRRIFRWLQPSIFADDFPKFTNWREENIKTAVKDAGSFDFEVLNWLYATSPNRSVHRIIARCVAVYPGIGQQFDWRIQHTLDRTLEINKTNDVDLPYGLCLNLLNHEQHHWDLLRSILDVEEVVTEYRSYFHIAENLIHYHRGEIMKDVINDDLTLPLVIWSYVFEKVPRDGTIAAHILTSTTLKQSGLFKWKCDPTRGSLPNMGVVSLDSEELGWWKFKYLYRHFFNDTNPDYSLDKTFETRHLLLITIYHDLTSDEPFITDKEQRQQSLFNLFADFWDWVSSKTQRFSSKQYFAFFIDIFCAEAFWSDSMTDRGREVALGCLHWIWCSKDTEVVNQLPFTECDDLSPIYQWCSRDLEWLSWRTTPIFTLLLMPQNRTRLCILLSNDPDAVSHLSNCFRNMGNCPRDILAKKYMYQNLIDLLKSVNPKVSLLFNVLYNSSVLVQIWRILVYQGLDAKKFFLVVKSKLDQEKLINLHATMTEEVHSESPDIHQHREKSVHEFGQMIGVFHSQLESTTEKLAPAPSDKDHDTEERAHDVPDANERSKGFHPIANWTKKAFVSVWPKTSVK